MRTIKYFSLALFTFFFTINYVLASNCDYKEKAMLNGEIGNVKANYEIKEKTLNSGEIPDALKGREEADDYVDTTEYIKINILNITENIYIEVTNDIDDIKREYHYSDSNNGTIEFDWNNISEIAKFNIVVKADLTTSCFGETLRTINLNIPRYNDFSNYDLCNVVPDFYMCQRYVNFNDNLQYSELIEKVKKEIEIKEKNKKEEDLKWYKKIAEFVIKNKIVFIGVGIGVVGIGGVITFVIIKRRRSDII